ncbi:S-layer family protein, partial [Pseudomonas sp. L-22-4S-12]|uniref:beta strand repeat-containing protein n=1 Tax=Pseudomonas sp. L-22-4S-12 TaxID=2610893 RepID=UPI001368CD14
DGDTASATVSIDVAAGNDAPTGTDDVISLNEDGSHSFSAADFGFTDTDSADSLQAVRIDSLPGAGSLQLNGAAVGAGQVIALADLDNLTFKPAPDASADDYANLTFSVSDQAGLFDSTPNTLTFDVAPVADAPIVTLNLGTGTPSITTISSANATASGQGFSVSAVKLDGTAGVIAINGSPNGFGVAGAASGADSELGQANGQSERIAVTFDAPVANATVSFAWLHTGERATYELFDSNDNPIGSGTIAGLTDAVDPAITLTSSTGAAIGRIEFSAPGGGDNDYLINSIEFVSSIGYPLTITATPSDIDHSESIASITVAVPDGATLSAGTDNLDGTWTLPLTGAGGYSVVVNPTTQAVTISGLTMTIPGNPVGNLSVTVTATAQDGADTESASANLTIGDTGAPETDDELVSGNEDAAISITLSANDSASSIANFTIDSLPANGTLSYNGQAVQVGQAIPAIGDQAVLSFTPNANWNGSTEFQYLATDVAGNADQSAATVSIQINPVNDAPVNNLPASYSSNEDSTLKLSGLSVSDVDASASSNLSVSLSVNSGLLSASSSAGVSVNGSGTGSLLLTGSLAAINAYLADAASQPVFTPVTDASGTVTLSMISSDNGNTGAGGPLTDSDSINIIVNPVADAVPGSDVSLVIGAPLTNEISFVSDGGLTGLSEYTFGNGVTISTSTGTFHWSNGNDLGVDGTIIKKGEVVSESGDDEQRIEGSDEAITFTFPYGMQYMDLRLKNSSDDSVLIRSNLDVGDLTDESVAGRITSSSGLAVDSTSLKIELVLNLDGQSSPLILDSVNNSDKVKVNADGTWSADLSGISGTILAASVNAYVDGSLFNQGGNGDAGLHYSIDTDMTQLAISQDAGNLYQEKNNGFQIEYIAVDANPTGLTSYSYPVDLYAVVQDQVGTAETFTGLTLSDLPDGSTLSVALADGTYREIMPDAQGVYDLSAYTDLLNTATTTVGTDKIYLITPDPLPDGYAPTLAIQVSDGGLSSAWTILGGSDGSTHTGGAGNDYISGGAGNDSLIGDSGNDILLGGSGADLFTWTTGDTGNDVIKDFNAGEGDRIDLSDLLSDMDDSADLSQYLGLDTDTSTLLISTTGTLATEGANVTIKVENAGVNVLTASDTINSLIAGGDSALVKVNPD